MDGQTSGPPKPLLDFVLSEKVSTEAFNRNQTSSFIASWQCHGCTDDEIYYELEVISPYHGHPLSWYEFAESIDTKKHDIVVAVAKKGHLSEAGLVGSNNGVQKEKKMCRIGEG
jgi:hypothetical protein